MRFFLSHYIYFLLVGTIFRLIKIVFLILGATLCEVEELTPGYNMKDILSGIFLTFFGNLGRSNSHFVDSW